MKLPQSQKRLTNIAVVRFKAHGLKFEVAWCACLPSACAMDLTVADQLQEHGGVLAQPDVRPSAAGPLAASCGVYVA
jgi:hypothetical protein